MMARFKRALARIEDSWQGDLIGTVSLFGIGYLALFLGFGWGL